MKHWHGKGEGRKTTGRKTTCTRRGSFSGDPGTRAGSEDQSVGGGPDGKGVGTSVPSNEVREGVVVGVEET